MRLHMLRHAQAAMLLREVLGTRRMPLLANTRLTIFSFLTEETLSPPYLRCLS